MAKSFQVDSTSQKVEVKAGEKGSIKFIVTNTSDLELDGEIKLEADGAESAWFALQSTTLVFSPHGKQEVEITIAPPADTPKTDAKFRLVVTAQGEGDTDFTEGPWIALRVDEIDLTPFWKKWWFWVVVGVVVAGIAGLVVWLFLRCSAIGSGCDVKEDCCGDYVCQQASKTCRIAEGSGGCDENDDCVTNYCEEGVCVQKCAEFRQACGEEVNCCDKLDCAEGVCLKSEGEVCEGPEDCAGGFCNPEKRCAQKLELGQPCEHTEECRIGLLCADNRCRIEEGGDGCSKNDDCVTGNCQNNVCMRKCAEFRQECGPAVGCCEKLDCVGDACLKVNGESCRHPQECASAFCSQSRRCADKFEVGAPCGTTAQCQSGLVCHNRKCLLANGASCQAADQCVSGYCMSRVCSEKPACVPHGLCPMHHDCIRNVCVARSKCGPRDICKRGYSCAGGYCRPITIAPVPKKCKKSSECKISENCISSKCIRSISCKNNAGCPLNWRCDKQVCRPNAIQSIIRVPGLIDHIVLPPKVEVRDPR